MFVKINGVTLASIINELIQSDCDKEGLLLGSGSTVCRESISDISLGMKSSEMVVTVTSYIPCEWQFSWYTNAGHVSADKLSRLLSSYEREEVIGWYKLRRQSSLLASARECAIHTHLVREFCNSTDRPADTFVYLLCTINCTSNLAAHSLDHAFFVKPVNGDVLQAVHMEVVNLKDTNQSSYLTSSVSNAAGSVSRTSVSGGSYRHICQQHRSLFADKRSSLGSVQTVSDMSAAMCKRLKELCKDLVSSEEHVGGLREEVKQLEDKLRVARLETTKAHMSPLSQAKSPTSAASPSMLRGYTHSMPAACSPAGSDVDLIFLDDNADDDEEMASSPVIQMQPPPVERVTAAKGKGRGKKTLLSLSHKGPALPIDVDEDIVASVPAPQRRRVKAPRAEQENMEVSEGEEGLSTAPVTSRRQPAASVKEKTTSRRAANQQDVKVDKWAESQSMMDSIMSNGYPGGKSEGGKGKDAVEKTFADGVTEKNSANSLLGNWWQPPSADRELRSTIVKDKKRVKTGNSKGKSSSKSSGVTASKQDAGGSSDRSGQSERPATGKLSVKGNGKLSLQKREPADGEERQAAGGGQPSLLDQYEARNISDSEDDLFEEFLQQESERVLRRKGAKNDRQSPQL